MNMPLTPLLQNGDCLTQKEFHRRYKLCGDEIKAELVGGIVYMASPLRRPHATRHLHLGTVFGLYEAQTPGVEALDNATTILGEYEEPQPDLALRVLPEYGGQSREDEEEYIVGAPELLGEISHSSRSIDMHQKRRDYKKCGVLEYMVACLQERKLHWFHFPSGAEIVARRGVYRSRVFPGLWIDGAALFARDLARLLQVAHQGLALADHAAFVHKLAAAKRRSRRPTK